MVKNVKSEKYKGAVQLNHTQLATKSKTRLYNLDYLRGLAAFGIMIYHYLSWTTGQFAADTFLGRIGIYGVSIFYILSGLTLYYVYNDKIQWSRPSIVRYFKKRVLRIFPLLWLVTFLAIVLAQKTPDYYELVLNLTGLFGFIQWDTYFSSGIWSIGNELVFYVFCPIFILLARSSRPLFIVLSTALFSIFLYFTFVKLNPELALREQWSNYVNPLNQVFLFLGGFLIGLCFSHIRMSNGTLVSMLVVGLGLFVFWPAQGNTIHLVTGPNRLIFTFCSFLICFCIYKLTFSLPKYLRRPLVFLGNTSYSVYLLHPIAHDLTGRLRTHTVNFPESVRLLGSVVLTLVLAYFTFEYFEKFFIKRGKLKGE